MRRGRVTLFDGKVALGNIRNVGSKREAPISEYGFFFIHIQIFPFFFFPVTDWKRDLSCRLVLIAKAVI